MRKSDFLIIIIILILSISLILFNSYKTKIYNDNEKYAYIQVKGELIKKIKITDEEQIVNVKTEYGINVIKIHDNGVEIIDADCPDKVCIKTGFIDKFGSSIVCLPNKLIVEIRGDIKEEIDELSN